MPVNEAFGWIWILVGFVTGLTLGMFFQRDDWLGGYASFRRRLLRLGHISFIGLGGLNVLFALSAAHLSLGRGALALASGALIVGGITMPLSCALMAWRRGFHAVFAIPVGSLLLGVALVVRGLVSR